MRLRDRDRTEAAPAAPAQRPRHVALRVPAPVVADRPPVRRHAPSPGTVLGVSSLGVFIAFVDATIVNIAFPDIGRTFPDAGLSGLSWVLSAYNIVFAAFLVAAGRLSDLLGRRRIFLAGLVVFTAASLLCALAPSAGTLIGFRVVQAIGAALMVPSSLGLVLEAFPAERRAHAVALLTAIGALAAGIGPSLGGLLVELSDWRLVFLVNVPIGIAAYVLSRKHLVESRAPGRRRMPDILGSLFFAGAVALLVLAVVQGEEWGWTDWRVLGSFAAALALGAAMAQRCTWHRAPVLELGLLRIRTFSAANSMTVVASAGFYGYTLINVLFLTRVWDYSILEAGLALTPGPFVAAAVAGPSSKLAEKHGHRFVLLAGGLIWAAAVMWLVTRVGFEPAFVSEWLPATILLGIGAGITFPNLSGAAIASAPGESFATATGLNSVARQVGAALGVALVVALLGVPSPAEAADAFDRAWTFGAACFAVTGIGCLAVGRLEVDGSGAISLPSAARDLFKPVAGEDAVEARAPAAPAVAPISVAPGTALRAETPEQFLASVPLLAGLPEPIRKALAARSRALHVAAGDWLFRKGDPGDAMYVVRAGRLEVTVDGPEGPTVRELGRGAALGELSLLTESPRSASVRAARETDLITIDREEFQRLVHESPEMPLALTKVLAEQLRASRPITPEVRPLPSTIALVALDETVPLAALAEQLSLALAVHNRVVRLDGSEAAAPMPGFTPAVAYGPLLDHAEAAADQVLLDGGLALSENPWTDFCLQQADRVLVVGSSAAGTPPPVGVRPELRGCDLVACDVAAGSAALAGWASALEPVETHAILPPSADEDVRRMARRLTGTSLGIVLSGGGARAFSHIGVLEELEAAGVVIDRVAGVSMGAFVAALYAMGMDAAEMDAHCYDEWVRRRPISDYTVPKHSLIKGDRMRDMLDRVYGTVQIEELRRSLLTGAADLRTGELVPYRHGPLWKAVGHSVCMPVLAPVQVEGRRLIIDGSLVDNLPIAEVARLGEGPLIAVDVKASFERPPGTAGPGGTAPERDVRAPGLGETLTRLLLLASSNTSDAARRHADLTIKPRNDGMGLLEFHQIDRAREAGRIAAREALEQAGGLFGGR